MKNIDYYKNLKQRKIEVINKKFKPSYDETNL